MESIKYKLTPVDSSSLVLGTQKTEQYSLELRKETLRNTLTTLFSLSNEALVADTSTFATSVVSNHLSNLSFLAEVNEYVIRDMGQGTGTFIQIVSPLVL